MSGPLPGWNVIIVGAGPAGATCALHLARQGCRVLILERQRLPRYKTCGGGVIYRARRLLEADLEETIEHSARMVELHMEDIHSTFRITRTIPVISMVMRSAFDDALVSAARRAGAEVREDCAFQSLAPTTDGLLVQTADGPLRAGFVVAADGASSPTALAAGWAANPHLIPAVESELQVSDELRRRFADRARFDFVLEEKGYAWVFPKRYHLSVGCLSFHRGSVPLRCQLDLYLQRLGLDPESSREDHGFVIPVAPRSRQLARNRVLLTGDAAGLADPVTCEGIGHAISSGRLAARAIVERHREPSRVAETYQHLLSASILLELRRARLLARLLYGSPWLRRVVFSRLGQPLCERMTDVVCGELSYRELLGSPARYFRAARRLVTVPPAYPKG